MRKGDKFFYFFWIFIILTANPDTSGLINTNYFATEDTEGAEATGQSAFDDRRFRNTFLHRLLSQSRFFQNLEFSDLTGDSKNMATEMLGNGVGEVNDY